MFWKLFTSSLILIDFSNYIKDYNKTYNASEYEKREEIYSISYQLKSKKKEQR